MRPRASPNDSDPNQEVSFWTSASNQYPQTSASDRLHPFEPWWSNDVSWFQATGIDDDFWDTPVTFSQPWNDPGADEYAGVNTSAEPINAPLSESRLDGGWREPVSLPSGPRLVKSDRRETSNIGSRTWTSNFSKSDTDCLTPETQLNRRPSVPRRTKSSPERAKTEPASPDRSGAETVAINPYPCLLSPYGCTASFKNKNEWKRHADTIHFEFYAWACDLCPVTKRFRTNRKDLFMAHLRRMHAPPVASSSSSTLKKRHGSSWELEAERRCKQQRRPILQEAACIFCGKVYSGDEAHSQRMDHVGQHMDNVIKGRESLPLRVAQGHGTRDVSSSVAGPVPHWSSWLPDSALTEWLVNERVVEQTSSSEPRISSMKKRSTSAAFKDYEVFSDVDAEGEEG